ncbi:GumC family protein, partial [Methylobacterium sp. Leaf88]|uniref:GumC family protein n=1 Tax=Methylobacterium sp. Leaf88 TaxID=1736244 RepID=UPI00138F5D14
MLTSDSRATPGMPFGKLASGDPESLGFLSGVLRRQRRLIIRVVLIALAIGTLIFLFAPSSYKASATVLVDFKRLAVVDEESKSTGRIDSSALLSQIEVLNSTGVLERTVISEKLDTDPDFIGSPSMIRTLFAGLGLADDPEAEPMDVRRSRAIEALRKATSVERAELSYAITVTVTARSGEKAARLANALAQAYIDDQMDAKRLPSEKASAWFSERITQLQNDAIKAERAVTDYRLKNNIVTTDGHFIEEQRVFDLSQVALKARFARAGAEAKVAQINEMARTGGVQNALVDELSNIVIIQLRKAYADAKRQMADFTVRYGATHEATIKARAKMNELQSSLNDEVQRILEGARSDFAIAQIKEQSVQKELADLSERSLLALEARFQLA